MNKVFERQGVIGYMENELIIKHVRLTFDEWNKTIQQKQAFLYEDKGMRYSLIELLQVDQKQIWNVFGGRITVADNGYKWLVISQKQENMSLRCI